MSDIGIPNESETNARLDISRCTAISHSSSASAIDEFEETLKGLVVRAATAEESSEHAQIRLLLLGLVSSCEHYFRRLLSELVSACPSCKSSCALTDVKFSSAIYYSDSLGQALTDNIVFSGAENVVNETKRLTGFDVRDSGSVKAALAEFQKVCVIRHATVHSFGHIGGKNAVDLKLQLAPRSVVALTSSAFQEIADVCLNVVRAYNSHMWKCTVTRLIDREQLLFDGSTFDEQLFAKLQRIFWVEARREGEAKDLYTRLMASKAKAPAT